MGLTQGMQKATLFLREELRRAKQAIAAQEKNQRLLHQSWLATEELQVLAAEIKSGAVTELTQRQAGTFDFLQLLHEQAGIMETEFSDGLYESSVGEHWKNISDLYGIDSDTGEKIDSMISGAGSYCLNLAQDVMWGDVGKRTEPHHYRHPRMVHLDGTEPFGGIPPRGKGFPKHCDHCARVAELKAKAKFQLEINRGILLHA